MAISRQRSGSQSSSLGSSRGAVSGIHGSVRPSKRGAARRRRRPSHVVRPARSTTAQPLWNTRGSSAASSLAAVPSAGPGQRLEQLQLAVGVQRPGERAERLDLTPGHGLGGGDQAVGQPVAGEVDHDVVHGDAATALEDVEGHDVDAGLAQRGGDGAQDAGPVGHHQAQEIGHGSSGSSSRCGPDLRRSRCVAASRTPASDGGPDRRTAPRRVTRSRSRLPTAPTPSRTAEVEFRPSMSTPSREGPPHPERSPTWRTWPGWR